MLLLKQNTTKKGQIDGNNLMKLDAGNSSKYKVKINCNNIIYAKKLMGYLLKLYYLIF